jgi:hypothetical protein
LLNRYVDVQSRMQLSGTHDDGEEIPIQKFSPMIIMQYFHYHVVDNPGVFEKAHGDLPDDANYDSVSNEFASIKRETKRSKCTQRASNSDRLSMAMQEYTKAILVGVDNKKEELVVRQQQLVATKQLNASTQHLNDVRARRESENLLMQLEERLENKIPDTPTRVKRFKAHRERAASRGGKTDENSIEAYADLMDRIQYNKEQIKRLQEKDK